MDRETNNPNTPNNVKPFKCQNETLKTELESLRKVTNPYKFMMINNITGYILNKIFKWKICCYVNVWISFLDALSIWQ